MCGKMPSVFVMYKITFKLKENQAEITASQLFKLRKTRKQYVLKQNKKRWNRQYNATED